MFPLPSIFKYLPNETADKQFVCYLYSKWLKYNFRIPIPLAEADAPASTVARQRTHRTVLLRGGLRARNSPSGTQTWFFLVDKKLLNKSWLLWKFSTDSHDIKISAFRVTSISCRCLGSPEQSPADLKRF